MRLLFFLLTTAVAIASPARADDLLKTINELPAAKAKSISSVAEMRDSGVTMEMVEAAGIVEARLLPDAVKLEAALLNEKPDVVRAAIERDLEAVSRDTFIRGNAHGEGGSIVKIECADARVSHLSARISWCVWQLTGNDSSFDFDAWHAKWTVDDTHFAPGE